MKDICIKFRITEDEYKELNKEFGRLCWKAAHELKRKNSRNNFTDEPEDIYQELASAMLRAGSYYKRQCYIEKCLKAAKLYAGEDTFMSRILASLQELWDNRTRHGANRQKFGPFQERILDRIVRRIVPKDERPSREDTLNIDTKFRTYCKAIVWNGQKSMGKKITREKVIRSGQVSLSEYDYLGGSL
jgi:hypothetical protein